MKKILTILLILILSSCEADSNTSYENSNVNKAVSILKKQGYDVSNFSEYRNQLDGSLFVVVENDHMFNVDDLVNPKRIKQYRTNNLLSDDVVQNIKVAIYQNSSSQYTVTSSWLTYTRRALSNWNSISGTKVNFEEVSYSSGNYDIVVYMDNLGTQGTLARSTFPESDGSAGTTVVINTVNYGLSNAEKEFTMTHELGHSLGFRHTNWFDRNSNGVSGDTANDNEGAGSIGAIHLSGTPTGLDEASIMKATVLSWVGFSNYDEIGLRVMYPESTGGGGNPTGIQGPNTVPDGQSATFTAPSGSSYQWYYNLGSGWRRWVRTQSVTFGYNGTLDLAVVVNGSDVYYKYDIVFY